MDRNRKAGATACLALLLLPFTAAPADAPRVMIRTELDPRSVTVGQTATLYVDVLTDTFFTEAPELPPLAIPGVIAKLSDERPPHLTDRMQGITWYGLRHSYQLTPIAASTFEIPAFAVVTHPGPGTATVTATAPKQQLKVTSPPGAEGAFVTNDLQITQKVDADLTQLKAGDAFTRTITLDATGTPAMFIPDVTFDDIAGLGSYPQAPVLHDSAPGEPIHGQRTFTVNYVVQQPGDYQLPAVRLRWWDLDAGKIETASVPPLSMHAVAAPAAAPAFAVPTEQLEPTPQRQLNWRLILVAIVAVVGVAVAVWWLAPYVSRWMRRLARRREEHRQRYLASEPHAFAQLKSALRAHNDQSIPAALYRWLDRMPLSPNSPHRAHVLSTVRDPQFAASCKQLLSEHYGPAHETNAGAIRDLRRSLHRVRGELLRAARGPRVGRTFLPEMNEAALDD